MHLFELSSTQPASIAKLGTQRVHDSPISSVAFEPPAGALPSGSAGALPLVAVGCKRGALKLLRWQRDGACAVLAARADRRDAVEGVVLSAGGASVVTAGADGKRLHLRWDAGAGELALVGEAAVPRSSLIGLAPARGGEVAVAASRSGRVSWQLPGGGRELSLQIDKRHGEARGAGGLGMWGGSRRAGAACSDASHTTLHTRPSGCRRADRLHSGRRADPAGCHHLPVPAAAVQPVAVGQGDRRHVLQGGPHLQGRLLGGNDRRLEVPSTALHESAAFDMLTSLHLASCALPAAAHHARQGLHRGSGGGRVRPVVRAAPGPRRPAAFQPG